MNKKLREALYVRSQGVCDVCGLPLPEDSWAAHHRKLRSQGGQDTLSNLLALHHACHNGNTNSVHLAGKISRTNGYLVSAYANPEETPVLLHGKKPTLLTDDGEMTETDK
jgi:hypothetical protein